MPYISKPTKAILDNDAVKCMRCGKLLDQVEMDAIRASNTYPCCDPCWPEVNAEIALNYSMWPNDWYGHAWRDCEGLWHVEIER